MTELSRGESRAERLIRLEDVLRQAGEGGATVPELAIRLKVHRRTIYRDLYSLQRIGRAVVHPEHGVWMLVR